MLASKGAQIFYGQSAENIIPGIDLVVYTAAIHPDNPEFAEARSQGLPMLSRAELLGQIMDNYNNSVAVAGTHGKTTTTSMISEILLAAKSDPTITVGGILPSIGGNLRARHSGIFLFGKKCCVCVDGTACGRSAIVIDMSSPPEWRGIPASCRRVGGGCRRNR